MNKLLNTGLLLLAVSLTACNDSPPPSTCYTCSSGGGGSTSGGGSSTGGSTTGGGGSTSGGGSSTGGGTTAGGSGGGGTIIITPPPAVSTVDSFVNLLHDRYGYISDDNFFVVKDPDQTLTEGFVVVYDWDIGKYVAYDLQNYIPGDSWSSYTYYADFQPVSIHDYYIDTWGETFYIGDAYDFAGYYQGEFVFEENGEGSKDLEKVSALMESYKVERMGSAMASEFGLSEERGIEIAKMATQMQKLLKKRALTEADANVFSKELFGVDMAKAQNAIVKKMAGDDSEFDQLLDQAAAANEISPEHMNKIISDLFIKS